MQELIDDLREFRDEQTSPLVISRMNKVLLKASSMLEKEKEQIVNAYLESTSQFAHDARIDYPRSPEEYYNETFN